MLETIPASIGTIKNVIELASNVKNLVSDAETKLKIAELITALTDAQIQLAGAQEEKLELQQKIKELENKLSHKDELIFRDNFYYRANPIEGKAEGPFCVNCFDSENKVSLLTTLKSPWSRFGKYECPSCKNNFN